MKKRIISVVVLVFALMMTMAACGEPASRGDEIIDAYIEAGYQKNPAGTETAAAAFSNLGDKYSVTYFAKNLSLANQEIFILFSCAKEKEAKEIESIYKDTYKTKRQGVDVFLCLYGENFAPWDSVFTAEE